MNCVLGPGISPGHGILILIISWPGISIGPGISPDPGPSSLIIYFLLILLDCDKISLIQAKDDVLAEKILLEDKENEEEINVTDKDD